MKKKEKVVIGIKRYLEQIVLKLRLSKLKANNLANLCVPKIKGSSNEILRYRDFEALNKHGFKVKEEIVVNISSLYVQRKINLDEQLGNYGDLNSKWLLVNSPFVEILYKYLACGKKNLKKDFTSTDFYKLFNAFNGVEYNWDIDNPEMFYKLNLTENDIWNKFESFVKLYHSIKKEGYLSYPNNNSFVVVLEHPYGYYYGKDVAIDGYEIWSGHHRASIMHVLGHKEMRVVVAHKSNGVVI